MVTTRRVAIVVCLFLLGVAQTAQASFSLSFQGLVQTINTGAFPLLAPNAILVDPAGNIYISDTGHNQIVVVNPQGVASVLSIASATINAPAGMAFDTSGNLYVASTGANEVVKITPSGIGSVIGMGGVTLNAPQGVAVDISGNLFIADTGSNRIVEVPSSTGVAAPLVLTGLGTPLNLPAGLGVDISGKLYIADSGNNRIVTVAAGGVAAAVLPLLSGVTLSSPSGVAVDNLGNVYIADTGAGPGRIVSLDPQGNPGFFTTFTSPTGVAVNSLGTIYSVDQSTNLASIISPAVDPSIAAGAVGSSLNKSAVSFGHISLGSSTPVTLSLDFTIGSSPVLGAINVFTAGTQGLDFQIAPSGISCTLPATNTGCTVQISFLPTAPGLRTGAVVLYDDATPHNPILTIPLYGTSDAPVAALAPNTGTKISTGTVALSFPFQLALDGAGNIYDANDGGNLVKIPAGGGSATIVAPNGLSFGSEVTGVALDGAGNLFISDHTNNRIIVITPGGVASVLSISGLSPNLNRPTAIAFDGAGNLFISDWSNGRAIRVSSIAVAGTTSTGLGTVIGTGTYTTTANGITGIAVDSLGNVYIPDGYNGTDPSRIIKVTAAGAVSLLAPNGITFSQPRGVTVDGMNNLYVADGGNNRIVKITSAGVASVLAVSGLPAPTALGSPFGVTVDPSGNLYLPDASNNRILSINVSGSTLSFAGTRLGSTSTDSPKASIVTNLGNQPLLFSTNPTYTLDFSNNANDTNLCTSSTSLAAGTVCDVGINFTPQSVGSLSAGITVTDNTLNVAGSTQQVSVSGTGINPGDTTSTTVAVSPTPLARGQAATITATVADTTSGHTATIPTGSVSFTDTIGSTVTTLNSNVALSAGKATLTGVILSGIGTHTITANYAGVTSSYLISSGASTVALNKAPVTLTGPTTQPVAVIVGQTGSALATVTGPYTAIAPPSGTVSYSILNAARVSVASGTPALTAGSTSSTATVPIPGTLASGAYTISITYAGDSNYLASSAATTVSLQISQIVPAVTWSPTVTTITYGTALTGVLNASALNGSTAVPGTFTYTATLSGGSAVPITSTSVLAAGTYTLTATFTPTDAVTYQTVIRTTPFTVSPATFVIVPPTTATASSPTLVLPGGTAVFPLTLTPTSGQTYPNALTLSVSGLPPGATATLTPSTIAAGSGATPFTLSIQIANSPTAHNQMPPPPGPWSPLSLALLLIPLAGIGSLHRRARQVPRLLLFLAAAALSLGAIATLNGCSTGGFFNQAPQTYTIVVTATDVVTHVQGSTTVTLTVQ